MIAVSAERHLTWEGAANSCAVMNLGLDKRLKHQTHSEKPRKDRQGLTGVSRERISRGRMHCAGHHGQGIAQALHLPSLSSHLQDFGVGPSCLLQLHRTARAAGSETGLELLRETTHK